MSGTGAAANTRSFYKPLSALIGITANSVSFTVEKLEEIQDKVYSGVISVDDALIEIKSHNPTINALTPV